MIKDFFITCSGADKQILKDCPTEKTKFTGIGSTIFLTAVLASISGGYAIYFTFNNLLISLCFGLLWGFMIFNLDRYIVSSIKKTGNAFREFFTAVPRLCIAVVLAFTISKPLEIKLFDGSITKKMGETEDSYNKKGEMDFNRRRAVLDSFKSGLQTELAAKKSSIYNNDPIYRDLRNQQKETEKDDSLDNQVIAANYLFINQNKWLENIVSRQGRVRKVWRYSPEARDKMEENKILAGDIAARKTLLNSITDSIKSRQTELGVLIKQTETQYGAQIAGIQQQIEDLNARRPEIIAKTKADAAADKDILSRLTALSQLEAQYKSVRTADLLITLLFVLLECAPVIVKLLAKRGPYDEILDRIEYEVYLTQQQIISDRNDEVNNAMQSNREANKLKREALEKLEKIKLEKEISTNETILGDIAQGQANLGKVMVDKWYEEELSKIK